MFEETVEHLLIQPSINAVAETYDLVMREPELASAVSALTGERVNRFMHITTSRDDVVLQNKMQRRLGQMTGTYFQRCVGMDSLNSLYSTTFQIDEKYQTEYHARLKDFYHRNSTEKSRYRRRDDRR